MTTVTSTGGLSRWMPLVPLVLATMLFRTAYYGARVVVLLFLVAEPARQGLGWTEGDALRLYGLFVALFLATPIVGGWIADRWLGLRMAVRTGQTLSALGFVGLYVAATAADPQITEPLLYASLAFVAFGNGLFGGPALSLFAAGARAAGSVAAQGLTLDYAAVCAGAILGVLLAGSAGEILGWRWGFLVIASSGALAALTVWTWLPAEERAAPDAAAPKPEGMRKGWASAFALLACFTLIFSIAFEQFPALVVLLAQDRVDRSMAGLTIPVSWFSQLSSVYGLLLAPLLVALAPRLRRGRAPLGAAHRFSAGLLLTGIACALVGVMIHLTDDGVLASVLWLCLANLLLAYGEVLLWPAGYAAVSEMAPPHRTATALGLWLLIVASFGGWLSGTVGAWMLEEDLLTGWWLMTGLVFAGALAILPLKTWLDRVTAPRAPTQ